MKKNLLFLVWVLSLLGTGNLAAQNLIKMAPKVVVINLGPKNPHFDESIFPHLQFYYTPEIQADITNENEINGHFKVKGSPEFLVKGFNEGHFKEYNFLLFDKNGVCYTEGGDLLQDVDMGKVVCANGKDLATNLKDLVKKGKTAKVSNKPLKWGKSHTSLKLGLSKSVITKSAFLTGHSFPDDVMVETADGKKVKLQEVIKGSPTLVMFIYIPPEGNLETMDKYYNGNEPKPSKAIQKKYVKNVLYLSMLEGQFFNFNPKKALKAKYGK